MVGRKAILVASAALIPWINVFASVVPKRGIPAGLFCTDSTPFVYAGCFTDLYSPRALPFVSDISSKNMTVESCVSFCKSNNYRYAGLENHGECFCGASVKGFPIDESKCNCPCTGNKAQACGGSSVLSIYQDPNFTAVDKAIIAGFKSVGCFADDLTTVGRALAYKQNQVPAAGLTIEQCLFTCRDGGYAMAGVESGGECCCGAVLGNGTAQVAPSRCNKPCNGNSYETCGGSGALNLYVAGDLKSWKPCDLSPAASSTLALPPSSSALPSPISVPISIPSLLPPSPTPYYPLPTTLTPSSSPPRSSSTLAPQSSSTPYYPYPPSSGPSTPVYVPSLTPSLLPPLSIPFSPPPGTPIPSFSSPKPSFTLAPESSSSLLPSFPPYYPPLDTSAPHLPPPPSSSTPVSKSISTPYYSLPEASTPYYPPLKSSSTPAPEINSTPSSPPSSSTPLYPPPLSSSSRVPESSISPPSSTLTPKPESSPPPYYPLPSSSSSRAPQSSSSIPLFPTLPTPSLSLLTPSLLTPSYPLPSLSSSRAPQSSSLPALYPALPTLSSLIPYYPTLSSISTPARDSSSLLPSSSSSRAPESTSLTAYPPPLPSSLPPPPLSSLPPPPLSSLPPPPISSLPLPPISSLPLPPVSSLPPLPFPSTPVYLPPSSSTPNPTPPTLPPPASTPASTSPSPPPSTTSATSLCTTTLPPTCEYKCGSWCSTSLISFTDGPTCKTAASACFIQLSSCFTKAGFPASLSCLDYSSWCTDLLTYCISTTGCYGTACSNAAFKAKSPPAIGDAVPVPIVSVFPCPPPATTLRPTTSSTLLYLVPVPTVTSICSQPDYPAIGYDSSSPVGGVPMPVLTCNNLKSEYDAGSQFKLYTSKDSASCPSYSRAGVPQGCKDACLAQYNGCTGTYAESCRSGGVTKYNKAAAMCSSQYSDCLTLNKDVSGAGRCGGYNSGWY